MPKITFKGRDGAGREINDVPENWTLLQICRSYGIDIEGACEGNMACATCHIVIDDDWYQRLDPPTEDEEDMLYLAYGLTQTSRLGCQIKLTAALDGLSVRLPDTGENV